MMEESAVRSMRQVFAERAKEHASARSFNCWLRSCNSVRALDIVLEDFGADGYRDPVESIPFPFADTGKSSQAFVRLGAA